MNTERIGRLTDRISELESFLKYAKGSKTEMTVKADANLSYHGNTIQIAKHVKDMILQQVQEEIKDRLTEIKKLAAE